MSRSQRKWEHITHALATGQSGAQGMDDIQFIPHDLPNLAVEELSIASKLDNLPLYSPIMINAMTGGSEQSAVVNRKIAIIAREKSLAMAVGSQMAGLRDPSVAYSYEVVRKENPKGLVFANLGAEATVDHAKRAVEMLHADALQIHLNVMQELIMPEGDRDFRGYLHNIEQIVSALDIPLIVKQVGFGMSRQTIRQLVSVGVKIIDVGGRGGTNFAKIENARQKRTLDMFNDWGLTTVQSLLEAAVSDTSGVEYIATGGMENGLDIAKAVSLGANAVGMAGLFLRIVQTLTLDECMDRIDQIHQELRMTMIGLGCQKLFDLRKAAFTISGDTEIWARQRGINVSEFALRDEENSPYTREKRTL